MKHYLIISSVNYSDFLVDTIPAWKKQAPNAEIWILTSPDDQATKDLAEKEGVNCFPTDEWYVGNKPFSGGAAKNHFLNIVIIAPGDLVSFVDADIYPLSEFPPLDTFTNPRTCYGFYRHGCETPRLLRGALDGGFSVNPLKYPRMYNWNNLPHGYSENFLWRPEIRFKEMDTLEWYDIQLMLDYFDAGMLRDDLLLLHLGSNLPNPSNWTGHRQFAKWESINDM